MSTLATPFVSSAEAAFIAQVRDRDVNRVIDEHIVPDELVRLDAGRKISRLAAAFISFYFRTDSTLTANFRKEAMAEIVDHVKDAGLLEPALRLDLSFFRDSHFFFFQVKTRADAMDISVDLSRDIDAASNRAKQVDSAMKIIRVDDEVMNGTPVFEGTRVPVHTILASLEEGVEFARLKKSYPFLTEELIDAAQIYGLVRPRRGRPKRLPELHPEWRMTSRKVVRAGGK